jgi:hypothetical protein
VFLQILDVKVVGIQKSVRLDSLRPRFVVKVIISLQALVPFDSLL